MKKVNKKLNAAIIVIGNEILSGRTQDVNVLTISNWLNGLGVKLGEVRVIPDVEETIIKTINEIIDATKRTILKSPAFIKMLYSIIKPNIVDKNDIFFITKFSSKLSSISLLIQNPRIIAIPKIEDINKGSVIKLFS